MNVHISIVSILIFVEMPLLSMKAQNLKQEPVQPKEELKIVQEKAIVEENELCPICSKPARQFKVPYLRKTHCCKKFICADDAQMILDNDINDVACPEDHQGEFFVISKPCPKCPDQQEKMIGPFAPQCPSCGHVPLTITKAFFKKVENTKLIKVVDADGVAFELDSKDAAALKRCKLSGLFEGASIDDSQDSQIIGVDFRDRNVPFATQKNIGLLVQYIRDVKNTPKMEAPSEIYALLDLANYLEAPKYILYEFANRAWPLIQAEDHDPDPTKQYYKHLRSIAQHYLANPAYLAEFLMQNKSFALRQALKKVVCRGHDLVNLSHAGIGSLLVDLQQSGIEPSCQDDEGEFYDITHPFSSVDGLSELKEALAHCQNKQPYRIYKVNLSGHAIGDSKALHKIFEAWPYAIDINLDKNRINKFDGSVFSDKHIASYDSHYPEVQVQISLRNNALDDLDHSFFDAVRSFRVSGRPVQFNFENNPFKEEQKRKIKEKMYKATHSLPEQYVSLKNVCYLVDPSESQLKLQFLAGMAAGAWGCHRLLSGQSDWLRIPSMLIGGLVGGAAAAVGPLIGANYLSYRLAKISDPKIRLGDLRAIWSYDKPKLKL